MSNRAFTETKPQLCAFPNWEIYFKVFIFETELARASAYDAASRHFWF
jgi:hypothetical protein